MTNFDDQEDVSDEVQRARFQDLAQALVAWGIDFDYQHNPDHIHIKAVSIQDCTRLGDWYVKFDEEGSCWVTHYLRKPLHNMNDTINEEIIEAFIHFVEKIYDAGYHEDGYPCFCLDDIPASEIIMTLRHMQEEFEDEVQCISISKLSQGYRALESMAQASGDKKPPAGGVALIH